MDNVFLSIITVVSITSIITGIIWTPNKNKKFIKRKKREQV